MEMMKETETFLEIGNDHRIYVREFQQQQQQQLHDDDNNDHDNEMLDMVVVHGGPGLSDHTEILEPFRNGLLQLRRRVLDNNKQNDNNNKNKKQPPLLVRRLVFYDQLGCGQKSDKPADASCYSMEASVKELAAVLAHVNASSSSSLSSKQRPIVLLGYSWGGQVVLEYIRSRSSIISSNNNSSPHHQVHHVQGAIISNAPLDEQTYAARQLQIRQALDETLRAFLEQEEQQTADSSIAYKTLIGTSDTNITGSMRDWSILPLLLKKPNAQGYDLGGDDTRPFARTPLLLICGEHDTVPCQEYQAVAGIHHKNDDSISITPQSNIIQAIVLAGADHAPFYGQTKDDYFAAIQHFLTKLVALQPGHV